MARACHFSAPASSLWRARVNDRQLFFPIQAEDEALLSEEDPIDRRPWTQQHLEAADIRRTPSLALTPPQAEQEVAVLDVNVRGPGQCFNSAWLFSISPPGQVPLPTPQTLNELEETCVRNTATRKL